MTTARCRSLQGAIAQVDAHPRSAMWLAVAFAVLYYLLAGLQGLDFVGEGASLTSCRFIFSHPADVEYSFLYYLTVLVGGVWELAFGSWGNYGYRVLFALVSGCIVGLSFTILRRYFKASTVLLAMLACILWPGLSLYYFNAGTLSVLLSLLSVLLLQRALDGRQAYFYAAGFVLMLNAFARMPNVLLFVLLFMPLVVATYTGEHWRAVSGMLRMLGGMLAGLLVMLGIMYALGHLPSFLRTLQALLVMGGDSTDSHGIGNLLADYLYAYKMAFKVAVFGFLVSVAYVMATQLLKVKAMPLIAGVCAVALVYGLLAQNIYGMWGAVAVASLIYVVNHYRDVRLVTLGIAALVMLLVLPLGGSSYYNICNSCLWLGMPLLVDLLRQPVKWDISFKDSYRRLWHVGIDNVTKRRLCIVAGVAFLFYVVLNTGCCFDEGSRFNKHSRPGDVPAVTTFTSEERARLTDSVVDAIRKNAVGDYMLVFDNAPMLHYLTGLRPYLGSPLTAGWGEKLFEMRLFRAENSARSLPLIAVPHFYYEDLSPVDYFNAAEWSRMAGKAEALLRFMSRNGYREVYSDAYISLYVPYDGII